MRVIIRQTGDRAVFETVARSLQAEWCGKRAMQEKSWLPLGAVISIWPTLKLSLGWTAVASPGFHTDCTSSEACLRASDIHTSRRGSPPSRPNRLPSRFHRGHRFAKRSVASRRAKMCHLTGVAALTRWQQIREGKASIRRSIGGLIHVFACCVIKQVQSKWSQMGLLERALELTNRQM